MFLCQDQHLPSKLDCMIKKSAVESAPLSWNELSSTVEVVLSVLCDGPLCGEYNPSVTWRVEWLVTWLEGDTAGGTTFRMKSLFTEIKKDRLWVSSFYSTFQPRDKVIALWRLDGIGRCERLWKPFQTFTVSYSTWAGGAMSQILPVQKIQIFDLYTCTGRKTASLAFKTVYAIGRSVVDVKVK